MALTRLTGFNSDSPDSASFRNSPTQGSGPSADRRSGTPVRTPDAANDSHDWDRRNSLVAPSAWIGLGPVTRQAGPSTESAPQFLSALDCHRRIAQITRRWASDRVRDSVAATDIKQNLMTDLWTNEFEERWVSAGRPQGYSRTTT